MTFHTTLTTMFQEDRDREETLDSFLSKVLLKVDAEFFNSLHVHDNHQHKHTHKDLKWFASFNAKQKIFKICLGFYRERGFAMSRSKLPDIALMARDGDKREEEKLMMLVLGIVVLEGKMDILEAMKSRLPDETDLKEFDSIINEIQLALKEGKEEKLQPPVLLEYQVPSASPVTDRLWELEGKNQIISYSTLLKENKSLKALQKESATKIASQNSEVLKLRSLVNQLQTQTQILEQDNQCLNAIIEILEHNINTQPQQVQSLEAAGSASNENEVEALRNELKSTKEAFEREKRLLLSAWYEHGLLNSVHHPQMDGQSNSWLSRQRDWLLVRAKRSL